MASLRGCLTLGFLFLVLFFSYGSHSGLARKIISDDILLDSKRQLSEEYSMPDANAPMPSDSVWVPELVKEDSKGSLEVPHDHGSSTSGEVPHDHGSSTSGESKGPGDVKVNCGCPACAPAAVIPNCPSNCPSCGGVPAYYPPQPTPGCHTPPHTEPLNPQPEPMNPPQPEPMNPPQPEPLNPPQPGPVNPAYPCPPYQPSYPPQVNPGCQPASPAQPEPTYPPQVNPGCQPASPPQFNPGCQPASPQPEPTYPPQPEPNYPPQPEPNYPPQPTYPPQPEPTYPPQPAYPPQPEPTYPPWHRPSYPPKENRNIPPPLDGPRGKLGCSLLGGCKSPRSSSDTQNSLQEWDIESPLMNEVQLESINEKDGFMNEESRSLHPSSPSPSMNEVRVESIHKNEDDGFMNEDSWSGPSPPTPPSPRSS